MRLLRPMAVIAAFLAIAFSTAPSSLSQTAPKPSQSQRPAPPNSQPRRQQRADALARAIKELLETRPLAPESTDENVSGGNASEDEDKPPADDAPIKELVAYWTEHTANGELAPKLSDRVRQRLLEACEDQPELFASLTDCLPKNEDTHDRIYKLLNEDPEADEPWMLGMRDWLMRNSSYFRDDLIKAAGADDDDADGGINNLRDLAGLDWNAAKPILERLASAGKAVLTPVALTLLYKHAMQEGDSARAESYRALLKAIVENRQAIWTARLEALGRLMDSEWSGQDEWFISLFADPTISGFHEEIEDSAESKDVAAAILNDDREWKAALESGDAKTQLALLASARYLRDKLPVEFAARLLNSPNRALAKAAESYLEIEDGPEARKLVLERHPGEMRILGDLTAIGYEDSDNGPIRSWEDALRKEMRGRNGLEAIYAVARIVSEADFTGVIIRVRGGKAEMSVYQIEGRRNVRSLTESEFEELKSLTSRQEIEDLGPESYFGEDNRGYLKYEYLRLTKESGRRIALDDLRRAPKNPTPHEELSGLFYRLSRSGEFAARYNIEDKIPGVEVVFADKRQSVLKVCAENGEIRALIEEKSAEYRQGAVKDAPEWREFSSGKPGEVRDEPSACRALDMPSSAVKYATVIRPNPFGLPAQPGGATFDYRSGEGGGVWKAEPGTEPVKIVSGSYSPPVITPDYKWLVAIKGVIEKENVSQQLIRRNLQSGEEFVVSSPQNAYSHRLEYVAAHGKVLALIFDYVKGAPDIEGYLLDPETGTTQPVKGEFRPLINTVSRAPQSAGAPNLFWAAIYDGAKRMTRFGRYDSKNFVFTPLLEFPELELSGDDIWVDAAGGKIWFAYKGHLLRLPLPHKAK